MPVGVDEHLGDIIVGKGVADKVVGEVDAVIARETFYHSDPYEAVVVLYEAVDVVLWQSLRVAELREFEVLSDGRDCRAQECQQQ